MTEKNPDKKHSNNLALSQFLGKAEQLPQRRSDIVSNPGRLIFALDATASRQASWAQARKIQSQLFIASSQLGGLQLQLCYYRGEIEFVASPWLQDSGKLLQKMNAVSCLGGFTQLRRLLDHCLKESHQQAVHAVVIIADAVEENVDTLCGKAGQLGLLGVPLFIFQDGHDSNARDCFKQMAKVSKGAYAQFDHSSAGQLADWLSAAATFASGGTQALQRLQSPAAKQLLQQLSR
ncbi:MAG: hypothetical protein ACJAYG_000695 [Oceanicoccus sp.]|jgi:hypothetical protein